MWVMFLNDVGFLPPIHDSPAFLSVVAGVGRESGEQEAVQRHWVPRPLLINVWKT